jgi:hypothetical protein
MGLDEEGSLRKKDKYTARVFFLDAAALRKESEDQLR